MPEVLKDAIAMAIVFLVVPFLAVRAFHYFQDNYRNK